MKTKMTVASAASTVAKGPGSNSLMWIIQYFDNLLYIFISVKIIRGDNRHKGGGERGVVVAVARQFINDSIPPLVLPRFWALY